MSISLILTGQPRTHANYPSGSRVTVHWHIVDVMRREKEMATKWNLIRHDVVVGQDRGEKLCTVFDYEWFVYNTMNRESV